MENLSGVELILVAAAAQQAAPGGSVSIPQTVSTSGFGGGRSGGAGAGTTY